jgi:excisionase family DNA binding protein
VASPTHSEPSTRAQPSRANRRHPNKEVQRTYVGIPEAATYLGVDHKTIRRLITSGKLPAGRLGNRVIKIRIADLDAVLTPLGGGV